MTVLNPATGQPFRPRQSSLSDEDILKLLNVLNSKVDAFRNQLFSLGLFTEFMMDKVQAMTDANGEPLFHLEPDEYEQWVAVRVPQMQAEAKEMLKQKMGAEAPADNTQATTLNVGE